MAQMEFEDVPVFRGPKVRRARLQGGWLVLVGGRPVVIPDEMWPAELHAVEPFDQMFLFNEAPDGAEVPSD